MKTKSIGEILNMMNIITEEQIEAALHVQKATGYILGEIFINLNFVSNEEVAQALAFQYNLDYVDLEYFTPTKEALAHIDAEFATLNKVLPLKIEKDHLLIATPAPNDKDVLAYLKETIDVDFELVVCSASAIEKYLQLYYDDATSFAEQLSIFIKTINKNGENDIILFLELLVKNAIFYRASDIHIMPQRMTTHIFFRIDGVLKHTYAIPTALSEQLLLRIKVLSKLDIAQHLLPQDGNFGFDFFNEYYNIRVATLPTLNGEKVALRLMPENFRLFSLEYLGYEPELVENISKNIQKNSGIILLVGPSGSGKTTSMYAMLRKINILQRNVISIEDPVEYRIPFVNQVQINPRINYKFDTAVQHIARQDPDVIAIGEIFNENMAQIALRNSLTGHLILSTLSSSSAIAALSRLGDLGVDPYMLANGLSSIIFQKLMRRLCNECKQSTTYTKEELIALIPEIKPLLHSYNTPITLYEANGCEHCRGTGYMGRIAIAEAFDMDKELRKMIETGSNHSDIEYYLMGLGYQSIHMDALKKVLLGISSIEEMQRIID